MRLALLAALALSPVPAVAQGVPDRDPIACEVISRSEVIRIALCDAKGSDVELAAFGRIACEGTRPCGTWFWTDAGDAPAEAPANHDGLSQPQVTSSLGVYVAEQDMMIRIEAVPK